MTDSRRAFSFREILLYGIAFLLPVGTKKFVYSFKLPFPLPLSYESVFLYLLDILVAVFVIANVREIKRNKRSAILFSFLAAAALSIVFAVSWGLSLFVFAHLLLFAAFSLIVAEFLKERRVSISGIFASVGASAVFESVVAFFQFGSQGSIGLKFLGESVLGPATPDVARVTTDSGNFLRVYGTMPHANILAAFLVFGFVSIFYFFFRKEGVLIPSAGLFFVFAALVLTFSRSGFIVFLFAAAATIFYGLLRKPLRRKAIFAVVLIAFFVTFAILGFGRLATARDSFSAGEPSVTYRIDYALIALDLIKTHPFFGVGLGNQIIAGLDANLYQGQGLSASWQWQPVHNLYLLVASETGVVGLVLFLAFLWNVFWPLAKDFWNERRSDTGLDLFFPLVLGVSWILFALVDHFFWDLESGQLMFWLTMGIMMGMMRSVSPRSSMDRTSPSEGENAGSIPAEGTKARTGVF